MQEKILFCLVFGAFGLYILLTGAYDRFLGRLFESPEVKQARAEREYEEWLVAHKLKESDGKDKFFFDHTYFVAHPDLPVCWAPQLLERNFVLTRNDYRGEKPRCVACRNTLAEYNEKVRREA